MRAFFMNSQPAWGLRATIEKDVLDFRRRDFPYHQMRKAPGGERRDRHSFRSNNIARWIKRITAAGCCSLGAPLAPAGAGVAAGSAAFAKHLQTKVLRRTWIGIREVSVAWYSSRSYLNDECHNRIHSTSLSVISSFIRS